MCTFIVTVVYYYEYVYCCGTRCEWKRADRREPWKGKKSKKEVSKLTYIYFPYLYRPSGPYGNGKWFQTLVSFFNAWILYTIYFLVCVIHRGWRKEMCLRRFRRVLEMIKKKNICFSIWDDSIYIRIIINMNFLFFFYNVAAENN